MSTISFFKSKFIFAFCIALSFCFSTYSQTTENQKTYVITANRTATEELKATGNITVISSEEIAKSGKTSLVEVLKSSSNLQITEGTNGSSSTIIKMRGASGDNPYSQVVIFIDGKRINNPDMTPQNLLSISISQIEKIEILDGGNSALYGSGAIGGVINIITKKNQLGFSTQNKISYGSYNTISAMTHLGYGTEKFGINFSGDYLQTDGYREHNKSKNWNANLSTFFKPTDYISFNPFIKYSGGNFDLSGPLTKEEFLENPKQANYSSKQNNDNGNFSIISSGINFSWNINDLISLDIPVNYDFTKRNFDNYGYSTYQFHQTELKPKLSFEKNIFNTNTKIFVGFDFYHTDYTGLSFIDIERKNQINNYNILQTEYSPYINCNFEFKFPLSLNINGRYTYAPITAKKEIINLFEEDNYSSYDYGIGLSYKIIDSFSVYTRYNTLFRIPFVDEKTALTYISGYHYGDFNKELLPESGWNYEIGTKYENEKIKINLNSFYMIMKNEIAYSMINYKNENMDKTKRIGINFLSEYNPFDFLKLNLSVSYVHGIFAEGIYAKNKIPLNASLTGFAQIDISLPFDFNILLDFNYTGKQYASQDYANQFEQLKPIYLLGATFKYTPKKLDNSLSIIARFENILNLSYPEFATYSSYGDYVYSYYYPAKKFNFNISLIYKY